MSRPHDDAGDLDDTGDLDEQQDTGDLDEQQDTGDLDEQQDTGDLDEPADDAGDSFPRAYVEQLRRKQQTYRHRAKVAERRAEQLSRELYRSRVDELGLLADPDDMEYDDELLMDGDALRDAVSELVRTKPHLAARRVRGNIGQHEQPAGEAGASLGAILRRNA